MFVNFTMKVLRLLSSCATEKAKIVLYDLKAESLQSGDKSIDTFDAYLIIHSPSTTRHGKTSTKNQVCTILPLI